MSKMVQAVYQNGSLILQEKLDPILEGQILHVIVLEAEALQAKKEQFLNFVRQHGFALPPNYRFDRNELYDR